MMGAPVRVGASVRSALHPRPRLVVHLPCEGRCAHLVAVQLGGDCRRHESAERVLCVFQRAGEENRTPVTSLGS